MLAQTLRLNLLRVSLRTGWLAAGLFLLTLISRLPFQPALLNNFDAVNYALALEHFDMRLAQPQAPGYPLYVLLGRIFLLFTQWLNGSPDPRTALVWLSMVFGGLAVAALFWVGQNLFNRRVGLAAAAFLATSTVFWYESEIAAPYTADLFISVLAGWQCFRLLQAGQAKEPGKRYRQPLLAAAVILGLAGAFRLQTLLFLAPLFAYSVWAGRRERRGWVAPLAGGLAAASAVFLVFFLPAIWLSGGPAAFLRSMVDIVPIFRDTQTVVNTTRWVRFAGNIRNIASYTLRILGELLVPLVAVGFAAQKPHWRFWRDTRLAFLILWFAPGFLVFFLIWPGNMGTMLVTMPPFFLLAGAGLDWTLAHGRRSRMMGSIFFAVLLAWSVIAFTLLPELPLGKAYRTFENYASLRRTTNSFQQRLRLVSQYPPESTVVFADGFRHMQFYLPQYRTFSFPIIPRSQPRWVKQVVSIEAGQMRTLRNVDSASLIPSGTRTVILFDWFNALEWDKRLPLEAIEAKGAKIRVITLPQDGQALWVRDGPMLELSLSSGE